MDRPSSGNVIMRRLRVVVTAGVLVSAVWVAVRTDLLGSLAVVRDLDPMMVLVASMATIASVLNRGFLNHESRSLHGVQHRLGTEIRMAAASVALNKVVKSGGLAGLAFYIRCARRDGACVASVTRAFVTVGAAAHLAVAGLVVTTLLLVPRDQVPVVGALSDMVVGGLGLVALAVVFGVFVVGIVTSRSGLGARRTVMSAVRIVLHAGANKLLGICTLAAVLAATGTSVAFETVVVVYATALVGGALSVVPAGIGVVEASTVAVLTASGVDPGVALVAVLAFRLFDLWLPVGIGWVLARRLDAELLAEEPGVVEEPVPAAGRRSPVVAGPVLVDVDLGALRVVGELA